MTLGTLIRILKSMDQDQIVETGFGEPHSYRGYYDQVSFEPKYNVSVKEMLKHAKSAIGPEFTGYKGGEFTYNEYTDVWFAPYGTTMDQDHSPSETEFFHMIGTPNLNQSDLNLRDLVEAFYSQKPLPGSSVTFKMKMAKSIEYLKSKGYELPKYEKVVKSFKETQKKENVRAT